MWGRDECNVGEMWNSNSVISWALARSGADIDAVRVPSGGRAPGWDAGLAVAAGTLTPHRIAADDRRAFATRSKDSVNADFLSKLAADLARDRRSGDGSGERLVRACVEALDVTGAGIMLMVDDEHRGTLGTSDAVISTVEELQFTLGEGPCVDAYRGSRPVTEPNLGDPVEDRWHEFSGPALAAGVAAIFGFPLLIGGVRLGALNLYSDQPGDLRPQQYADALEMADVAARAILDLQAEATPGALATELASSARMRSVVHQASGMVSVQLDLSVKDALVRLRAYSYAEARPIDEVAKDVVDRTLRFQ